MKALSRLRKDVARQGGPFDGRRYFVGIDLGTTNSSAAVFDAEALRRGDLEGALRLVPVRQETEAGAIESATVPSVVAEIEGGVWRVGHGAKEARRRGLVRGRNLFLSTKSDMGLGREPFYPYAPKELDAPWKVAARILTTLRAAVEADVGPEALETAVVTVPASFQLAARKDTFRAAEAAGLTVGEQALLDEPNAALLDYLLPARSAPLDFAQARIVVVLDFGGGTCDVSVVRVQGEGDARWLALANLAVSRYERLGGDNVDAAIAEHVLLPDFLQQNRLEALDFTLSEKRDVLLPQLLPVAEALKLAVAAKGPGRAGGIVAASAPSLAVLIPPRTRGRTCEQRPFGLPTLTRPRFEQVLEPFLDRDFLYARGSELNPVTSIFAPLTDALDRARVGPEDVDAVLLAGGSSLLPQVGAALAGVFTKAALLRFPDAERTLAAVARGAALHSFFLHGVGRPLLRPIAQETLGLLAQGNRFVPLIEAGTELPYPADGSCVTRDGLAVPRDLMGEVEIVLAADSADKVLSVARLQIAEVRSAGQRIEMGYRLDANKILELTAWLADDPESRCAIVLENPLCSTRVASDRQQRILELEQEVVLATAERAPKASTTETTAELAQLCFDEQRFERSIDWARTTLASLGRPVPWILNVMGNAYDRLGARDRAEKSYREAVAAEPAFTAGWFNIALMREGQGQFAEALEAVERACALRPSAGAYQALRGRLLRRQRPPREAEAVAALRQAARLLDEQGLATEFDRSWRAYAAEALADRPAVERLEELARPDGRTASLPYDPEKLPAVRGDLARAR